MDIGELLDYKPPQALKRPVEVEDEGDDLERARKMRRIARAKASKMARPVSPTPSVQPLENITEEERAEILKFVETEQTQGEVIDETTLKKIVLNFEKRSLKNREMRIKFPDSPEKFMDSEVELHETLQEMRVLATAPDYYPLLVKLQVIPSLLELLAHDNTDISVATVELLQELTDVDILNESEEGADTLIEALLEHQVIALLVQNLDRLDESVKEEADGVHNTLSIIENLTELSSDITNEAAKQGLLTWLLKRLKVKAPFDANKLYVSEILSILLQDNEKNQIALGNIDGIDTLLQQLAFYKRHDPSSPEEHELMENLFNCLCSALMVVQNRDHFLKGEGLQLMNLMLREKKTSRNGSLKVLDYAMSGPHGKDNCNKFVDILGLRTIFPLFMKTPKKNRRKVLSTEAHEEHVCSIIASMLRNCRGSQRQRLVSKFTENDHEKVDRLLELHFKYLEKVELVEDQMEDNADDEEASYLKRLEGGLFILQLVDYIIVEVCAAGPASIKQRVMHILNLRGASLKTIKHIMREYAGNLGEEGDKDWRDQEQQHILNLVDKF
ncbi:beta-catenin-like protein 1 [Leptinotarsa decemlineata]|uniref:beta-catenin-like protein 1 n=1 Tax=Leptinotarsa decemlineata TaxID=7539 RepID=UPI000C25205E|nr:beta-catenin-like protein 1 [Leptinotarsa decemlineata]XP_023020797.1 beta-catenin-like protein 1 [Leptinotarsa decemlineata]